jgi:N-acetylmuramoyl-L-alanine amidase
VLVVIALAWESHAANLVHAEIEPGATAAIMDGRVVSLEVRVPTGDEAQVFLERFLNAAQNWKSYKGLKTVGLPYQKLNQATQRRVMEALFPEDYVDASGWWHTVTYYGKGGVETLFGIAEWFTGKGTNFREILTLPENHAISEHLKLGDKVLIPRALLIDSMTVPTPAKKRKQSPVASPKSSEAPAGRNAEKARSRVEEMKEGPEGIAELQEAPSEDVGTEKDISTAQLEDISPPDGAEDLRYGEDKQGKYAEYRIKQGETVYSDVVVRFTDMRDNEDVQDGCDQVLRRSGIKTASAIQPGQALRIPLEILSDAYQPAGSQLRQSYDEVHEEARKLKAGKETAKGLKGVLVILDPGHGGRDKGAMYEPAGLYEDELTYDIVVRLKRLLETKSQAKVYTTLKDPNQGYEPSSAKKFIADEDEQILTTPVYPNEDGHVSAALRWYLANDIYRKSAKAGIKDSRALFLSIHCDSIFNGKMRGTMIYVPGAAYRRDTETADGDIYNRFAEARAQRTVKTTARQRERDEALSYNFASTVISTLSATRKPTIKVHSPGEPIRNVIRQKGGRAYVPAVLRNCMVPTKVLVETANLMNAEDRKCLADPLWRQAFAEALFKAINVHFGG